MRKQWDCGSGDHDAHWPVGGLDSWAEHTLQIHLKVKHTSGVYSILIRTYFYYAQVSQV